jgi:ABC-type transport system involved in cytochrome bd biosynthesis fused ATPase/permease subunit
LLRHFNDFIHGVLRWLKDTPEPQQAQHAEHSEQERDDFIQEAVEGEPRLGVFFQCFFAVAFRTALAKASLQALGGSGTGRAAMALLALAVVITAVHAACSKYEASKGRAINRMNITKGQNQAGEPKRMKRFSKAWGLML